jgi:hypothetical protein
MLRKLAWWTATIHSTKATSPSPGDPIINRRAEVAPRRETCVTESQLGKGLEPDEDEKEEEDN